MQIFRHAPVVTCAVAWLFACAHLTLVPGLAQGQTPPARQNTNPANPFRPGADPAAPGAKTSANKQSDAKASEKKDSGDSSTVATPLAKPRFSAIDFTMIPSSDPIKINPVKPGHWSQGLVTLRANEEDFVGLLRNGVVQLEDGRETPLLLEGVQASLVNIRTAPLPKGQQKSLESMFYLPTSPERPQLNISLETDDQSPVKTDMQTLTVMPDYQYYGIALASNSSRYRRLQNLETIRVPGELGDVIYYRLITPVIAKSIPVPSRSSAWTSIAWIIWDDIDPSLLTTDQATALVDWLHWGGQIIVSGPDSLDKLRGSVLGPYLPAESVKSRKIDAAAWEPLKTVWQLPIKNKPAPDADFVTPWAGIEMSLTPGSAFVAQTGDLVAERRVGRGRVVVTAFRLSARQVLTWPSFDGFFNGCLLRRPPREFVSASTLQGYQAFWADGDDAAPLDARLITGIRYFTRDGLGNDELPTIRELGALRRKDFLGPMPSLGSADAQRAKLPRRPDFGVRSRDQVGHFVPAQSTETPSRGSAGRWNSFDGASRQARLALQRAAGIEVPDPSFIGTAMFVYLMFLVPLNYFVFRLIGRLEWAWFAVPAMAVVGSFAVVKLAQLDIGFVRAQTEVAILETQPDYPRGHLTRYTAMYTSLSTNYDLMWNDASAVAQPFAGSERRQALLWQSAPRIDCYWEPNLTIRGLQVQSNSTAMVHSEQMVPLAQGIVYRPGNGRSELINRTPFSWLDAVMLHRSYDGQIQAGYVGELLPGVGKFVVLGQGTTALPAHVQTLIDQSVPVSVAPNAQSAQPSGGSSRGRPRDQGWDPAVVVEPVLQLAMAIDNIKLGETRLVARIDGAIPGLIVDPAPSQSSRTAVVLVAHLRYAPFERPLTDRNTRRDIVEKVRLQDDDGPEAGADPAQDDAPAKAAVNNVKP